MSVARQALRAQSLDHLIPNVHWWQCEDDGLKGLMVLEHKAGMRLDSLVRDNDAFGPKENSIISQLAAVFTAFQSFQLPATIGLYGGLSFDNTESLLTSGALTTLHIQPQPSYAAFLRSRLSARLHEARECGLFVALQSQTLLNRILDYVSSDSIDTLAQDPMISKLTFVHEDFCQSMCMYVSYSLLICRSCVKHPCRPGDLQAHSSVRLRIRIHRRSA